MKVLGAGAGLSFVNGVAAHEPEDTVSVRSHSELGDVLVGPDGMTLYMFDPDTQGAQESACYDDCAEAWPPLTTDDEPTAGDGVTAELATFERETGEQQVAAGGWPLYYFVQDEEPGDVTGQGVNDVWWVLRPDGTPVRESADEGDDETAEESDDSDATLLRQLNQVAQATNQFRAPETNEDRSIVLDEDGNEAFERADFIVGGMGEHFTNAGFEWDLDIREPDILSYGFTEDDEMVLGAIEWTGEEDYPQQSEPPADIFAGDVPEGAGILSEEEAWGVDTLTTVDELEDEDGNVPDENIPEESPWVLHVWAQTTNFGGVFKQLNCRDEFHRQPDFYEPTYIDTTIVRPQFEVGHAERVDASEDDCQRDLAHRDG